MIISICSFLIPKFSKQDFRIMHEIKLVSFHVNNIITWSFIDFTLYSLSFHNFFKFFLIFINIFILNKYQRVRTKLVSLLKMNKKLDQTHHIIYKLKPNHCVYLSAFLYKTYVFEHIYNFCFSKKRNINFCLL